MYFSNMTFDEVAQYATPEEAMQRYTDAISEVERMKAENAKARYEQRIEILEEQIYFARTLLESLEERLRQCTSVKQARDAFKTECANSMFER